MYTNNTTTVKQDNNKKYCVVPFLAIRTYLPIIGSLLLDSYFSYFLRIYDDVLTRSQLCNIDFQLHACLASPDFRSLLAYLARSYFVINPEFLNLGLNHSLCN